ncbi:MAG: TonB family protein [Bacteroidetes bacterium]|nr:TonB family protein [Bacteroidota bacterium]
MKIRLFETIVVALILFMTSSVSGQNTQLDTSKISKLENQYPTYIQYYIHYPDVAKQKKIEGTIIITYDIDSNCSIVNRQIIKKLGYGFEEEALKVLDQYEAQLKQINKSSCIPAKGLQFPVKFKL